MADTNNQSTVFGNIGNIIGFLLIFAVVIGLLISGTQTLDKKQGEMLQQFEGAEESEYTMYEARRDIAGTIVQAKISQWKNDPVCVTVKTKTNATNYNFTSKDLQTAVDAKTNQENIVKASVKTEKNYINPNGVFSCTIERDDNMTIREIIFEQLK